MNATIEIKSKIEGKWPKIQTVDGSSFGVSSLTMLDQFKVGGVYEVEYSERDVQNPKTGRTFKARDITSVVEEVAKSNGHSSPSVAPATPTRELWMARMNAINNAVEMTKCEVDVAKTYGDPVTKIDEIWKKHYEVFLKEITRA